MPFISIITINLNNASGLQETLDSVCEQTFYDWELLVIDEGSTDNSLDIIEKYKSKIRYSVSEKDRGRYDAMNKGILVARGEYLIFLNSGDFLLHKNVFTETKGRIDNEEADIYYGDIEIPKGSGRQTVHYNDKPYLAYWRTGNINHQAALYKRTVFEELGMYSLDYKLAADNEFNLRAFMHGNKFLHLGFPMVYYDVNGQSSKNFEAYKNEMVQAYDDLLPVGVQKIINEHSYYQNLLKQRIMKVAFKMNKLYHNIRGK